MSAYTTNDLIKSVRVRGMFPDASKGTLSAENILLVASEELRLTLVPMIMAAREKYYETFVDYPMISGQEIYKIPDRAVGGIASVVQYVINESVTNVAPLDPNQRSTTGTGSYPKGFYFENDHIVIYPKPNATQGTIRVRYFQRTSLLEQTLNCAQITVVDEANSSVTLRTIPASWSSAMPLDFISDKSPYAIYGLDKPINVISAGNNVSFVLLPYDRDNNLMVKAGDWLSLAGYSPIPEIPSEFFPLLAQATAARLLIAIGDDLNGKKATDELTKMQSVAIRLITPREQFGLKKVKSDWRNW